MFKCEKCNREFKYRSELNRHLNRRTPCDLVLDTFNEPSNQPKCRFCGRLFANKHTLSRHVNYYCKIPPGKNHPGNMELLYQKVKQQEEENRKMRKEINDLKEKINTSVTIGSQETTNHSKSHNNSAGRDQQINNITINNFGNENLDYITPEKIFKMIEESVEEHDDMVEYENFKISRLCIDVYNQIINDIYSNPDHKENINAFISNKKEDNVMVYKNRWLLNPYNDVELQILRTLSKIIKENLSIFITGKYIDNLDNDDEKFRKTDRICCVSASGLTFEDEERRKLLHKYVENALINNKSLLRSYLNSFQEILDHRTTIQAPRSSPTIRKIPKNKEQDPGELWATRDRGINNVDCGQRKLGYEDHNKEIELLKKRIRQLEKAATERNNSDNTIRQQTTKNEESDIIEINSFNKTDLWLDPNDFGDPESYLQRHNQFYVDVFETLFMKDENRNLRWKNNMPEIYDGHRWEQIEHQCKVDDLFERISEKIEGAINKYLPNHKKEICGKVMSIDIKAARSEIEVALTYMRL